MPEADSVIRCPTCRASQAPAAQCRRCQCDLSLVLKVHRRQRALEIATLRHLRGGRYDDAAASAEECYAISNDDNAARLLAVSYLGQGRFQAALDVYDRHAQQD